MVVDQTEAGNRLTSAAAAGDLAGLKALLRGSAVPPDTANQFGKTALQVMMFGNSSVAGELLKHGASVNVQDGLGVTPAHDAARTGFVDTLRVLVEYGASVNTADSFGALPVHVAVSEGHVEVVRFLAPRSDLRRRDKSGESALDRARVSNQPAMVEILERQLESEQNSNRQ
ncbi:CDN2D inhibitor, partial [Polyodon spathula]|nr:cyclin-dependent kinase 4 inhibitor D [Polyodon spathula]MBN3274051.1 CDN2D inhibitor [Polyodon spathula]